MDGGGKIIFGNTASASVDESSCKNQN